MQEACWGNEAGGVVKRLERFEVKNRGFCWYKKGMKNSSNSAGNSAVATFNPASFTLAPAREPVHVFWGHGHTLDTDPTRQGWKVRRCTPTGQAWVVGQPGKAGCASIIDLEDGRLDVCLYDEDPKTIDAWLKEPRETRRCFDAGPYHQIPAIGGAGLMVIRLVQAHRKSGGL
jgi:hypothetical protein